MPKGVMWRQDDLYQAFSGAVMHDPPEPGLDAVRARVQGPGPVALPACPLMHGTGQFTSFQAMFLGGSVVLLPSRHFDVEELLDTIQAERVNALAIVGDAFAKPMLQALDDNPGRWDISSLVVVTSSGVMWSETVKQGLLKHHPGMMLVDAFSSSEALGMGQSVSSAAGTSHTAKFVLGENARVITDDGRDVVPGSGEAGMVAVGGNQPVGYYKDPDKSARTFRVIDGKRYSIPGDYATVEADGTLRLLGRGSVCINTGGEKVYPEEVEEVLKEHPLVRDAVVVGVPDDRFGEAITALVEPKRGATLDETAIVDHVKSRLAGYKAPRRVLTIESIGRAPNGKVDYRRLKDEAMARLGR
jgi:fatty-acyl-CoA synthase